jgi:hypothetical protein
MQAEQTLPDSRAARAWALLRINANVRKASRVLMSSASAPVRNGLAQYQPSSAMQEEAPLLAPNEELTINDEAAEAMKHLGVQDDSMDAQKTLDSYQSSMLLIARCWLWHIGHAAL